MDLTVIPPLLSSSVLISYSHTYNSELKRSPLSIVTALVDKIGKNLSGTGYNKPLWFVHH